MARRRGTRGPGQAAVHVAMATWSPLLLAAACASLASASCGTQHNDTMHLQRLRKDLLCLYDREAGL